MGTASTESPIWLSHHWQDQHDRCVRLGGHSVCRRCLVLYPLVVLWAGLTLAVEPPAAAVVVAIWLLPLPMSLEWAAEQLGVVGHAPRRLVATTALASVGLGAALAVHLRTPFDPDALAPVATHVTVCGVSSVVAARQRRARGWQAEHARSHEREEAERERALRLLWVESGRKASKAD